MNDCFFVSDLHGSLSRYGKLFRLIETERPQAVFMGGDLLPGFLQSTHTVPEGEDFIEDYLASELTRLKRKLGADYPRVFIILGNDDGRLDESAFLETRSPAIWEYCHGRALRLNDFTVYGYSFIPPTPFRLKDWERYDVSRYVDPGCTSPLEGYHTVQVPEGELRYGTIKDDLDRLAGEADLSRAIFLFHSPPHETVLDRAALDGKMVDHVPLDVHVGSIAIKRFIMGRKPLLTLHGHVHESASLTGSWKDRLGDTVMLGAAHDGPELALVRFSPFDPEAATRDLV